jgi:glycosyltransferase involved in cell wall biosynthesis
MEATSQVTSREITESRVIFLVWAAPTFGSSRSKFLTKELEIPTPVFFYSTRWKAAWTAPLRYTIQGIQTLHFLFQKRPRVVIVQSPPSFAVLFVALYCAMTGSRYIIDAHSGAFQREIWKRPAWLYNRITRRAAATLVTDKHFREQIEQIGGKAILLRTLAPLPPAIRDTPHEKSNSSEEEFTVTVVNSFSPDEPLNEIMRAAHMLPHVRFQVTGNRARADPALWKNAPRNVVFTDYLPRDDYERLLRSSHAVMSLTTRDHTFQCGASEALAMERPVITSNWPLLREYFSQGTVHVENTIDGIRQGIERMRHEHDRFEKEIVELHAIRRKEWLQQTAELADLI